MVATSACFQYQSYEFMKEANPLSSEEKKEKSFEDLEAKIIELENALRKEKEPLDESAKIAKIIRGDAFDSDFLH